MKEAEWELQRLGRSQDPPGIVIMIVTRGKSEEYGPALLFSSDTDR
jgi:hypothetical protein